MAHRETKPFRPYITLRQIADFNPDNPETYTDSRLVNAVCEAFAKFGYVVSVTQLAEYLCVSNVHLTHAIELITGYNLNDLRCRLIALRWDEIQEVNPDIMRKDLAKQLGFADHTALWRFVMRWKKKGRSVSYAKRPNHTRQNDPCITTPPDTIPE